MKRRHRTSAWWSCFIALIITGAALNPISAGAFTTKGRQPTGQSGLTVSVDPMLATHLGLAGQQAAVQSAVFSASDDNWNIVSWYTFNDVVNART